jgi:dTDP-4-amino-4,6-dideoxygalactose transaminase
VEPDQDTFLMSAEQLAPAITQRTRAIIPVHLYGKCQQLGQIRDLAAKADAFVIEDAAQAHGARSSDGVIAGTSGHVGCFSFHPSKNLAAAGDAGAMCTNSDSLASRLQILRALGQRGQNDHVLVGMNSKLDALQAVVLSAKLPSLDKSNARRHEIATLYKSALSDLPVRFQHAEDGEVHVYHLFQIATPRRDELLRHLNGLGIEATIRYPTPIHLQPAFADLGIARGEFPVAERLANELLVLPIRPDMSEEEIQHVVSAVRRFFEYGL